jgi:DNA modification methylase
MKATDAALNIVPDRAAAVVNRPVNELRPYAKNARTHSKAQIRKIAESIRTFGFTNPVLIDADETIIAGHGRVEAAKLLKLSQVPTIKLEALTPSQVRAYALADNRLALDAGWDEQILRIELQNLVFDSEIDVSVTGFEMGEIDLLLEPDLAGNPDDDLPPQPSHTVTKPGDLWDLGHHRILCGDARNDECYRQLMGENRASIVFTDPPYNVVIDGHASGNGRIHHREFAMASGEMSEAEFTSFLHEVCRQLTEWSTDGSVHYICMDFRHMRELLTATLLRYESLLNVCVWAKDNGGMGSLYRSQHEMIFVFKHGKAPHQNNVQLGKFGRNRTNVWRYPGANTLSRQGEEGNLLGMHPTVKPTALVADALLDCSARQDLVLDPFLGSGTTLLAAERTGRHSRGMELDPAYVDLAIRRWQQHTGGNAIHQSTGRTFTECEREVLYGGL